MVLFALLAIVAVGAARVSRQVHFDRSLPVLGSHPHQLPDGNGKMLVQKSCLPCHSADMIVQQRITEKQWGAEVDKMIKWGAKVDEKEKPEMVAYLSQHFGANNQFKGTLTRPSGY